MTTFQFHYGTIRSELTDLEIPIVFHFNSTMVRLEVKHATTTWPALAYFNSTMVRLEVSLT